eukprot:2073434-Pleurochrysis_carterae.AAC.1
MLGTSGGKQSMESKAKAWTAGMARGNGGGEGGFRKRGGGDGSVGDERCGGDAGGDGGKLARSSMGWDADADCGGEVGGDGGASVRSMSVRASSPGDGGTGTDPGMKLRAIPSQGGRRGDAAISCGASGKGKDMKRCASRAGGGNRDTRMPRSTAW